MDVNSIKSILDTKRLLQSQELAMGKGSTQVANTLNQLSKLHFSNGDVYEAEDYLLRAIDIKTHIYGEENKEVLPLLENLSSQYREQGDRKEDVDRLEEWQSRIRDKLNAPVKKPTVFTTSSTGRMIPTESLDITQSGLTVRSGTCLIVDQTGETVQLRKGSVWIGRDNMNDLNFPGNKTVERSHALISYESGNYWLMNRAAAAATTLNGKEVTKKSKIVCDDVIKIGDVTVRMQ